MSSVHIQTAIKVRPFIEREKKDKLEPSWLVQDNSIVQIDSAKNFIGDPYSFDHIFDDTRSNKHVYDAVVKPLVLSCFEGINSTIFAYGQTSSGKTHTMLGSKKIPGIISYAVQDIFSYINESVTKKFLLRCSYLEIYNEKINDLLDTNAKDIKIRENFEGGVYVVVKEEVVREPDDLLNLMNKGMKTRKIGCTDMNERSSRSHTIFKLIIQSQELHSEGSYVESALNLVDLAGSERVGQMNMDKERQVEGVSINKSLTTLGLVIRKLGENDSYINYRDSKLTRLLQHSLGGNSKTLIIANITVAALEETKSTLEFAQRAKYVKNQPIRNEKVTDKDQLKQYEHLCEEYKDQIEKLRLEKLEREKTINALEGKISNIELFSTKTFTKKIKPPNRRHTFAFKPGNKLFSITEPGGIKCEEAEEDLFGQISPAKSEICFPVTNNAENKENIFFEESCSSPPYKLSRPSLPKTPGTPYSTLRQEKQLIEESLESLKSFTSHEYQYGNELDDLKELVDKLRQENFELRADLKESEIFMKASEDTQDIYEKLLLLKSILEVKPLQDTRRNSLNTIFEEECDLFDGDLDSSIISSPIKLDNYEKSTNEICAAIIEENKDLKWQLNEKERIIRGLKNDFNSEKLIIDAAFSKLNSKNEDLLKEIDDIKSENEKLKIKIAQDIDIKECELEILNSKIKKLTDYKEDLHKKLSEIQMSQVSEDLTKINKEEWQNTKKELEDLKLLNDQGVFKIKELEEEVRILKIENLQKVQHLHDKELEAVELKKSIENIMIEKISFTEQIRQLKSELDDAMFSLSGEQKELETISQELEEKVQNIRTLEKQIEKYSNENKKLSEELLKKDELLQITIENAKQNKEIELMLKSTNEQFEEELREKHKELDQKSQKITALEKLVFEQEQLEAKNQERLIKLDELLKDIRSKDETIETLQNTVSEVKAQNQVDHSEKEDAIVSLEKLLCDKKQLEAQNLERLLKLNELFEEIREKDETIHTLQKTVSELKSQNQVDYSERTETIISLRKTIDDMKQDKEIENYKIELKTAMKQLETVSLELQEKSIQLEEKSGDIAVLNRKLSELEAHNQIEFLEKEETIENLQKKIEDMKQFKEIENYQLELKIAKEQLVNQSLELEEKNTQLKERFEDVAKLEKKLTELEAQNKIELVGKEETIEILQKKLQDMEQNEEIEKYQQELATATDKLETLSFKLHEKRKQLKEKSEEVVELERNLSELEAETQNKIELAGKEETIQILLKKVEDMKQNEEIQENQQELFTATEKLEALSFKLHEKSEQLKEKSEDVAELQRKLSDLEAQNKIEMEEKEEFIRILQRNIEDMVENEEIEKYQQELGTATKKLEALSFELQEKSIQLKAKFEDVAELTKKLSELEAHNKIEILEKEESIKIQNEEIKMYQQELATATEKLETLSSNLHEKHEQFVEKSEEVVELEKKLSELEAQNKIEVLGKEETIKILQKNIEDMKQNEEIEKYQQELAAATEKLERLSFKLHENQEQFKEKLEDVAELEKKLSDFEAQNKIEILEKEETIKILQKNLEEMKQNDEIEKYQQQLAAATEKLETLSSQLHEKHEQFEEKCKDVVELEKKLSELEAQNKIEMLEKEQTIKILQENIGDMKHNEEIEKLQQELAAATDKLETLSFKLHEKQKQFKEKSEDVAELEKKLSDFEAQNKIEILDKEEAIRNLQKNLEDMKQNEEIEKYQQELAAAAEKLETLSLKLCEKHKQFTEKCEDVEQLEKKLSELKSQNKAELEAKERTIEILQKKIQDMNQTIDSLQKRLEDANENKDVQNYKLELKTTKEKFEGLTQILAQVKAQNFKQAHKLAQDLSKKEETIQSLQKKIENMKQNMNTEEIKLLNNKLLDYENRLIEKNKLVELVSLESEKWEALHRQDLNNIKELSDNIREKNKKVEKLQKELETLQQKYSELTTIKNQFKNYKETELYNSKLQNTTSEFMEKEAKQIDSNSPKLEELEALKLNYTEKLAQFAKVKNDNADLKKQLSKMKENLLNKSWEIETLSEQIKKLSQNTMNETNMNPYQIFGNDSASQVEEIKNIKKDLNEKLYKITKLNEEKRKLQEIVQELDKTGLEQKRRLKELGEKLVSIKDKYHCLELELAKTKNDLIIKEQDLAKEKSCNRRLEQQLSALQKKMKHEPEMPPEQHSRHSGDGRVSPKELRKIKRQSLLEQRRGISSESAIFDNDSSDSECTNCTSIRKKIAEMSQEIDKLKEDNKYLDKENEDMLKEVDWLKEERLKLLSTQDHYETTTGLPNHHLEVASPHHKVDKETQATCDLHHKYKVLKKVVVLRREENNYLRKKLNLPADCPVLPSDLESH